MANYTVTAIADLIANQQVTHAASVIGADKTPAEGSILAKIWMYHALHEATANTNPGTFHVQTRGEAGTAGDSQWVTVAKFVTSNATSVTTDITATEAQGQTTIVCTSTTSFVAGDYIYIDDATDQDLNSEWHYISSVTDSTNLVLADGLSFAKASGDDMWTGAQPFYFELDLAGVLEYRVIYIHQGGTGANTAIWVRTIEATDFA